MRSLKALILAGSFTIIINTVVAISTIAQSNAPTQINSAVPQQRTNYIKQHVSDITTDQESKILSIELNCSTVIQNATNNTTKDSICRSTDSQIKAVLTPDQYTQYEKIKKNLPNENKGSY